mmetsp:Transcript_8067/g.33744  ORF Transcript_8067/g.33744 Transcript_8067/m.33744 type:complete len:226 (+) Transcript_8067:1352-2029(+)
MSRVERTAVRGRRQPVDHLAVPVDGALVDRAVPVDVHDVHRDTQRVHQPLDSLQNAGTLAFFRVEKSVSDVSLLERRRRAPRPYTRPEKRVAPPSVALCRVDARNGFHQEPRDTVVALPHRQVERRVAVVGNRVGIRASGNEPRQNLESPVTRRPVRRRSAVLAARRVHGDVFLTNQPLARRHVPPTRGPVKRTRAVRVGVCDGVERAPFALENHRGDVADRRSR